MTHFIAHVDVDDYEAWQKAFDDNTPKRIEHGGRSYTIFRTVGDENHLTVVVEFDDEAGAQAWIDYVNDPDRMGKATMHNMELLIAEAVEERRIPRPAA